MKSYVQTILFLCISDLHSNGWMKTVATFGSTQEISMKERTRVRFFFVIKFTKDCHNFKRLLLISCAQEHINMVNQSVSLLFEPWKRVNHSSNVLLMLNLTCNPYCLYLFFWVPANRHKSNSLSTKANIKNGNVCITIAYKILILHSHNWFHQNLKLQKRQFVGYLQTFLLLRFFKP